MINSGAKNRDYSLFDSPRSNARFSQKLIRLQRNPSTVMTALTTPPLNWTTSMEKIARLKKWHLALTAILLLMAQGSASADVTNWENNPMNFENSEMNFDNSPDNFNNSPMNFENNPMNFNSERVIRDNSGHPMGYEVPKSNGGVNYFDLQGHRRGYQGPGSR